MPAPDSHIAPNPFVLRVSEARAVLLRGIAGTAVERTSAAEAALRAATGLGNIAIDRRTSGRPRLAPPFPELAVSLSHRNDLLIAAFSPLHHVGVDIEIDAPDLDVAGLARDHFTKAEAKVVSRLSRATARDAFLRMWVAKEAALKITGRGVYDGLHEPDLADHLSTLQRDGAEIVLAASSRLPAVRIAVCRIARDHSEAVYCGLAIAST